MALSDRDCRHGRQIGKCADCDLDHMEMAADAEARRDKRAPQPDFDDYSKTRLDRFYWRPPVR